MTHAENRSQRAKVAAYRKAHPYASDEEIAAALGMTRERVITCRRAARIPAGRVYTPSVVVEDRICQDGPITRRRLAKLLGLSMAAADYHVRTLRQQGRIAGHGHPIRWRVVAA